MGCTCSICQKGIESENPAVLVMGGGGNPRYICEECEGELDLITLGRDSETIYSARARLVSKLTRSAVDDTLTLSTLEDILASAEKRRLAIADGSYDFSEEDAAAECALTEDEVPPELRETEEDAELVRKEEERNKKLDKITNVVCIAAIALMVGFVIYRIFFA